MNTRQKPAEGSAWRMTHEIDEGNGVHSSWWRCHIPGVVLHLSEDATIGYDAYMFCVDARDRYDDERPSHAWSDEDAKDPFAHADTLATHHAVTA